MLKFHYKKISILQSPENHLKEGGIGMKYYLNRKIAVFLVTLACAILITGCGTKTIHGEVTEVNADAQTGVFSFRMTQDDGESITVVTDQNTHIFSWIDEASEFDLRNGSTEGIMVSVTGRKSHSTINATQVEIEYLLTRGEYALEDGSRIDIKRGIFDTVYCLENGTELLMVRNSVGPDNVVTGGMESLDTLSQEAQQNIKAYYDEQGILYDVFATLEDAYDAYYILKDKFSTYLLSQEMVPTASSDQVIYFLTVVTMPYRGSNTHTELRLGAAFDKATGEVIRASDLFTCEPDEIVDRFIEISMVDDEALTAEMKANFKLEYVIFFPDNLEITFPAEALPNHGLSHGMGFDYTEEVRALLQPWAVPNGSRLE